MEIEQIKGALDAHEAKITAALERYEGQVKEAGKVAGETRAELVALAEKHGALASQLTAIEQKLADGTDGDTPAVQTVGEQVMASDQYKAFMEGRASRIRVEVKNTILGEGGSPQDPTDTIVPSQRLPGIVAGAFRALRLLDALPRGVTNSNLVEYTRELAYTNAAAETAEGVAKPQSSLTFELVQDPVRTIAHWLKVSKQALSDAPALQSYIDRRLRHGVENRLEYQVVNGNGTSPNLSGILASGNYTSFSAVAGESEFDAISRAKYAVMAADYTPGLVLLNPADWGALERTKDGQDNYVAGNGAALSYVQSGITPTIWGLPAIASNNVPEDRFIVLAPDAVQLMMRAGTVVEMFEQDEDNVQKNLVTVRAEVRAAFSIYRTAAIVAGNLRAGSPLP